MRMASGPMVQPRRDAPASQAMPNRSMARKSGWLMAWSCSGRGGGNGDVDHTMQERRAREPARWQGYPPCRVIAVHKPASALDLAGQHAHLTVHRARYPVAPASTLQSRHTGVSGPIAYLVCMLTLTVSFPAQLTCGSGRWTYLLTGISPASMSGAVYYYGRAPLFLSPRAPERIRDDGRYSHRRRSKPGSRLPGTPAARYRGVPRHDRAAVCRP